MFLCNGAYDGKVFDSHHTDRSQGVQQLVPQYKQYKQGDNKHIKRLNVNVMIHKEQTSET